MKVCPVCGRPGSGAEARCPHDGATLVLLDPGADGRPTDLLGQVIDGRYRIEGVVGRGGMGTVYSARHVVVGRSVAVKVLRPTLEHREETLARFVREAQAANAVKSRYILRADDFGQLPSGSLYVVMELLEGRSLGTALRERLLSRDTLLRVFVQLADGLGAAHAAGVVHRDLKPDNVFLVDDPVEQPSVRILDFGVAKLMSSEAGLTSTGVVLGTPHYMAPEQARGHAIDHRADVYALGIVMYQAFTGRLPFVSDSAVGVLTAHAVEEAARPALSGVDAALESVIVRCMRKRPEERFGSMGELGSTLRALIGQVPAGLPPQQQSLYASSPGAGVPSARGLLRQSGVGPAAAGPASGPAGFPAAGMSGVGGLPPAGPETSPGMTTQLGPPVSRGLYVALGAGVAVVGVVAAMLLAGPGGLLRGGTRVASDGAGPATPSSSYPATSSPATSPPEPATSEAAVATAALPALSASTAPSAAAGPSATPSAAAPAGRPTGGRPPTPTAKEPPTPPTGRPPRPGEIRSPFD